MKYIAKKIFTWKKKLILCLMLCTCICAIADLISPLLTATLIDHLTSRDKDNLAFKIVIIIAIVSITYTISMYFRNILNINIKQDATYTLESKLISKLLKSDYLEIKKYDPIALSQRIQGDIYTIVDFILNNLFEVIINFITIIISFIILSRINITFTVIAIASIPVYLFLLVKLKNPIYQSTLKAKQSRENFSSKKSEQLSLIHIIKTNILYTKSINLLDSLFFKVKKDILREYKLIYFFYSIDGVITLIVQILYFILGIDLIKNNQMTIGDFTILLTYYSMTMTSLRYFLTMMRDYEAVSVAEDRLKELKDIKEEKSGQNKINILNKVVFNDVTFQFSEEKQILLPNFSVNKGEVLLIKGENGKGKSTLFNLLLGIYKKKQGQILYDNGDIDDLDIHDLRKNMITCIHQGADFWNASVQFNLDMFNEDISQNIFINDNIDYNWLENNKESNIFELSGGQRKRIQLLSMYLKTNPLLILDEPTTSLDNKFRNHLKKTIESKKENHIIIIISHDSFFDDIANQIIYL